MKAVSTSQGKEWQRLPSRRQDQTLLWTLKESTSTTLDLDFQPAQDYAGTRSTMVCRPWFVIYVMAALANEYMLPRKWSWSGPTYFFKINYFKKGEKVCFCQLLGRTTFLCWSQCCCCLVSAHGDHALWPHLQTSGIWSTRGQVPPWDLSFLLILICSRLSLIHGDFPIYL